MAKKPLDILERIKAFRFAIEIQRHHSKSTRCAALSLRRGPLKTLGSQTTLLLAAIKGCQKVFRARRNVMHQGSRSLTGIALIIRGKYDQSRSRSRVIRARMDLEVVSG